MPDAEPQAGLTPITEAAIFLVLTLAPGAQDEVRDVLADAGGLRRAVGFHPAREDPPTADGTSDDGSRGRGGLK